MKKGLMTMMFALVLLVLTVYSASAFEVTFDAVDSVYAGELYKAQVNTTIGLENISLALESAISGMTLNPQSGELLWAPQVPQVGTHTIEVKATNTSNTSIHAVGEFVLTVKREAELSAENLMLGGSNQAPGVTITEFFEIKNLGSHDIIENVEFTHTVPSIYEFSVDPVLFILPDGSANAFVSIFVPENHASGKIGEIVISADGVQSITRDVYLDVRKNFGFKKIDVRVDSRREDTMDDTPFDVDVKPGVEIELTVTLENNLPRSSDNDMEDVEITMRSISDDADGQEEFISRLRSESSTSHKFRFTIDPKDFLDGDIVDVEIEAWGITRDGESYRDVWDLDLRIEADRYDLVIDELTLTPSSVCAGEDIRVSYELINVGRDDLSSAGIRYNLFEFGLSEWDRSLNLYSGDSRRMSRSLTIPQSASPGEYFLEVIAHPRMSSSSDTSSEILSFMVRDCEPIDEDDDGDDDKDEDDSGVITPPPVDVVVPGTPVEDVSGTKSSIFDKDSNLYIILLTALVVLLLVGVILLLVAVFRK
ncbi:MAG: hypothetical protein ACLFN8_02875 [Candidatus Woesearchaeota archaeon]